jgi:hypothetical protein
VNATNSSGGHKCGVGWYRNALQAEGHSPDPPLEAAGVGRDWIPWEGSEQSGMSCFYFLTNFSITAILSQSFFASIPNPFPSLPDNLCKYNIHPMQKHLASPTEPLADNTSYIQRWQCLRLEHQR